MVSYILLIVGAIGLSVLVYNYLKDFTPKGETECDEGVSLAIRSYTCDAAKNNLTITLHNNGKFNIPDFYVKIGTEASKIKCALQTPEEVSGGIAFKPGKIHVYNYTATEDIDLEGCNIKDFIDTLDYNLEIQPIVEDKKSGLWAVCDKAIVSQTITCS